LAQQGRARTGEPCNADESRVHAKHTLEDTVVARAVYMDRGGLVPLPVALCGQAAVTTR
jgi:hypothetical protein